MICVLTPFAEPRGRFRLDFSREVQEYLGHASVETTMIHTRVIRTLTNKAESPLDAI